MSVAVAREPEATESRQRSVPLGPFRKGTRQRVPFARTVSMRDDDFPTVVKELLAKRVAQRCSNQRCRRSTSGPQEDPNKAVNLGVAAHITAASPGGARYDPSLTPAQRRSPENGIWLCQTCGKLIDNDEKRYPVSTVREWKARAERVAAQDLERHPRPTSHRFIRLERLLSALLAEMQTDLSVSPLKCEFVLLKRAWAFWNGGTAFEYYFDDHPDLESQVQILENTGLVRDITNKNVKRYRMSEELVDYLTEGQE